MNTSNRPIPEAIDGLPWTVTIRPPQNHGGGILYGVTDLHGHAMTLPPEEHTSARFVRLHELAHAKFTPRNIPPHAAAKKANAALLVAEFFLDVFNFVAPKWSHSRFLANVHPRDHPWSLSTRSQPFRKNPSRYVQP